MNDYWRKACEAASEAELLLSAGKRDGVVSRAYYAMFDAARAALESVDVDLVRAKSHATIISRFGSHIVAARNLDPSLGRILNEVEDQRIAADYDRTSMTVEDAGETVVLMRRFLAAVAELLGEQPPP